MSCTANQSVYVASKADDAAADQWVSLAQATIRTAARCGTPLSIEGGGTRTGFAGLPQGNSLKTVACRGITQYAPDDLVITVRAGTLIAEVEEVLARHGQMLGFEPPACAASTMGGAVALGWSGARRPFSGALRDHLLGVRMLDGGGRELKFGGQVVKNVAGFDVARLMAGSLGIMGPLLEVSLRVIPRAPVELTVAIPVVAERALEIMSGLPLGPGLLTGAAYVDGALYLRSAGSADCVHDFLSRYHGDLLDSRAALVFWQSFNHHTHRFFAAQAVGLTAPMRLWRVSVRTGSPWMQSDYPTAIDWAGALRWIWAPCTAGAALSAWARDHGGHASLWSHATNEERQLGIFDALSPSLMRVHQRLKSAFDPQGIFNVGRMYPQF